MKLEWYNREVENNKLNNKITAGLNKEYGGSQWTKHIIKESTY